MVQLAIPLAGAFKMNAYVLRKYGRSPEIQFVEAPTLVAGTLRIEVKAVALNPVDLKTQEGEPKMILPLKPPFVLGVDFAGRVIEVGPGVSGFEVGDSVIAYMGLDMMGAFAESVVVPTSRLARVSREMSFEHAACLPLPGLSSLLALNEGRVGKGSRVLIHGGGGGVGSLAIQLAVQRGAEVWTTVSPKDMERVKGLGAAHVINYQEMRFEDEVSDMDFVLDTVGKDTLKRSFGVMRPGGVLASLHVPPPAEVLEKAHLKVPGIMRLLLPLITRGAYGLAKKAGVRLFPVMTVPDTKLLSELAERASMGGLSVHIDFVMPFEALGEALQRMKAGQARGRMVLKR